MRIILFAALLIGFVSCGNEKEKQTSGNNNILIPAHAIVQYQIGFDTTGTDSWQKNLKTQSFFPELFQSITQNKIPLYSPYACGDGDEAMQTNIVLNGMNYYADSALSPWYAGMYIANSLGFNEEWLFDTNTFVFQKVIKTWWPVFINKNNQLSEHLFSIKSNTTETLLAKDIITEINFNDSVNDFSKAEFSQLFAFLSKQALNNKISVNPASDYKAVLTEAEIKEKLGFLNVEGETFNLSLLINELTGIVFIEDWYYDSKTGNFSKKVKALGPVRHFESEQGDKQKAIPFVYYFGEEKINIL